MPPPSMLFEGLTADLLTMVHIIDMLSGIRWYERRKGRSPAGTGEVSAPSGARVRIRAGGYLRSVRDGDLWSPRYAPKKSEKGIGRGEL